MYAKHRQVNIFEPVVPNWLVLYGYSTNSVPRGLEDVSKYPELFAELLRSGQWSVQELKNLAGLNMLRVMRQVEKVNAFITIVFYYRNVRTSIQIF